MLQCPLWKLTSLFKQDRTSEVYTRQHPRRVAQDSPLVQGHVQEVGRFGPNFLPARIASEGSLVAITQTASDGLQVLAMEQSEQVSQALDWVFRNISRFGGDPNRVSLVGHSSGECLAKSLPAFRQTLPSLSARSD